MLDFTNVESLFRSFLTAATPLLSDSEQDEIRKFIEVGEYGLALETAADILVEEEKIASTDMVALIKLLAEAMSKDSTPLLQRLPKS